MCIAWDICAIEAGGVEQTMDAFLFTTLDMLMCTYNQIVKQSVKILLQMSRRARWSIRLHLSILVLSIWLVFGYLSTAAQGYSFSFSLPTQHRVEEKGEWWTSLQTEGLHWMNLTFLNQAQWQQSRRPWQQCIIQRKWCSPNAVLQFPSLANEKNEEMSSWNL